MLKKLGLLVIASLFYSVLYAQMPRPQEQGPFNDQVFTAISNDGINFKEMPGPLSKHSSVPDILELKNDLAAGRAGTLLLYFVDFSESPATGNENIVLVTSLDGRNWSDKQNITIEGKINHGAAVDPSIVELGDGRIRLYFFGSEAASGDPRRSEGKNVIYSAISDDGVHFKVEPEACFSAEGVTDPEVIKSGERWLMFLSRGTQTLLATSKDGLIFTLEDTFHLTGGGIPGAVELPNGKIRVFFAGANGIGSAIYDHFGFPNVSIEGGVRIPSKQGEIAADPSCVRLTDGTFLLVFKKRPQIYLNKND